MTRMPKEEKFIKGQNLLYTGTGFLGFDPFKREVEFVSYENMLDASVKFSYFSLPVLVRKYDLKKIK